MVEKANEPKMLYGDPEHLDHHDEEELVAMAVDQEQDGEPTVFIPRDWVRHLCVLTATAVVLCLSIACNFDSIYEGCKEGTAAATPHLFLLASQVMEGMASSSRFSSLIVKRRREKILFDFRGLRS
ncbi:hypothetical protein NL676_012289 [Syzygium grande]|nr:hypothetical protein NL676_012289 [Syzygium grande]